MLCFSKDTGSIVPCPRDLWNFELERNVEQKNDQKLELILKRETEHKSLENLQPDNGIEKKNSFSEEKFKPAAEICINNKELNVNHQDNEKNMSPGHVRDFHGSPFDHRPARRKNAFLRQAQYPLICAA